MTAKIRFAGFVLCFFFPSSIDGTMRGPSRQTSWTWRQLPDKLGGKTRTNTAQTQDFTRQQDQSWAATAPVAPHCDVLELELVCFKSAKKTPFVAEPAIGKRKRRHSRHKGASGRLDHSCWRVQELCSTATAGAALAATLSRPVRIWYLAAYHVQRPCSLRRRSTGFALSFPACVFLFFLVLLQFSTRR
jgi:hypothetical protein